MLKLLRHRALWMSFIINGYVALADWIIRPLHAHGVAQPALGYLNGLGALLEFPGLVLLTYSRMRPTYHLTGLLWWLMFAWNFVFWIIAAALMLRVFGWHGRTRLMPGRVVVTSGTAGASPSPSRRRFLHHSVRVAAVGAGAVGAYAFFIETVRFRITRRQFPLRNLPPSLDGLRIVQLTDIHHGPTLSLHYVRRVIRATNALRPDVILLTGDYVYRSPQYICPVMAELAELRAKIGIVGVLGNHDWWEDGPLTRQEFARIGIPLIDNSRVFISPRRQIVRQSGDGLCIAGVGDYYCDEQRFDDALGGVPESMPRLLLSHNPDVAEDMTFRRSRLRVDLMLSGHTHGGQIRLPGLGAPMLPSRYGQKYAQGLVQGPVCPVYVSRGVGTTALPMRFCIPPEIAVIEFTCS